MTKLSWATVSHRVVFGTLLCIVPAITQAQQVAPRAEQMAKTYGIDSWGQIEEIRYTFNLDFPLGKISRSWDWSPKTNTVSFEGKDKAGKPIKVTYQRSHISSESDTVKNEVDPSFFNDQYWLLFPFHAVWDGGKTVTDRGMQKLPSGQGSAQLLSVKYLPSEGGYTPGDTWNLYLGKDNRVEQLLFQHGGTAKPHVVIATWEGYKKAGPLLVSTDHRGTADGGALHLTFTGVSVKLAGSNKWMDAQ